jgi:hypothetical protein
MVWTWRREKVRPMIGVPAFGAQVYAGTALALTNAARNWPDLKVEIRTSALLCHLRNTLWHEAVTLARKGDVTHFVFLDADVAFHEQHWLDVLLREGDKHNASLLGCITPIKNGTGDTGAARETNDSWHPKNIHVSELANLPMTWTEPGLLLPLGCVLIDMRQAWVEKVCFTIADRVERHGDKLNIAARPEDWDLCRQARAAGATIFATKALKVVHYGVGVWTL